MSHPRSSPELQHASFVRNAAEPEPNPFHRLEGDLVYCWQNPFILTPTENEEGDRAKDGRQFNSSRLHQQQFGIRLSVPGQRPGVR